MTPPAAAQIQIGRLHLTCSGLDALTAQARARRVLDGANLSPPGIPRHALLCVKWFPDPLPGTVQLRYESLRPPPAWEQAAAASLERLARCAARPALAPAPESAVSVLFADTAEWLACLAESWCEGAILRQWWWRRITRSAAQPRREVIAAWLESPQDAPAALERLARKGTAVAFARLLSRDEALVLLRSIAQTFGLREIVSVIEALSSAAEEPRAVTHLHTASPPWRDWAPDTPTGEIAVAPELLLVTALMLQRAPAIVRSAWFTGAVREWYALASFATRAKHVEQQVGMESTTDTGAALPIQDSRLTATASALSPGECPVPLWPPATGAAAAGLRSTANTIDTALGGIFFLINLALFLELYGDFTTPMRPGIALPIWDFLELLARRLLADPVPEDPVWALLRELAGREEDKPAGQGFAPPMEWQPPVEFVDLMPGPDEALDAWLDRLAARLRSRLAGAFGVAAWSEAPGILFTRRARVEVTSTHLDVIFALAEASVEVRRAGLDRDPGWVPAAGRRVAFHFE